MRTKIRSHYLLALFATLLLPLLPLPASADSPESITDFQSTAKLTAGGSMEFTEDIKYDFGGTSPHPFIRTIPVAYTDDQGGNYPIGFTLGGAAMNGKAITLTPANDNSTVRITFPASTDTLQPTFHLRYTLSPVVLRGYTNDVFKLSLLGAGSTVPVQQASVTLMTPGLGLDDISCDTLLNGSNTNKCGYTITKDKIVFVAHSALDPNESVNITGSFPHGSFKSYLQAKNSFQSWLGFILIIVVLIAVPAIVILLAIRLARHSRRKHQPKSPPPTEPTQDK